jgi:hypothetical protein
MEKLLDKKVLVGVAAVVVAIAVLSLVAGKSENRENEDQMNQAETTTDATGTSKPTTSTTKTVSTTYANQPVSLSYEQALELYKDNKRIQISGTSLCQVSPNNVMYKNGTSIMLDNRSAVTRTIKLGGATYNIEGYGFRIAKLSSATLPITFLMDCGTQQNVAKVLLQK